MPTDQRPRDWLKEGLQMAKMWYDGMKEAGRQDGIHTLAALTRPIDQAVDRADKTIPSGTQTVNC